ncbi:proteasome maturation factor UMP1 [Macrolepiota fuliginosa MF-IS2]|uniref:Proteasome maturation factor UMP1 n=1 Tax=Macrolepiota fuliginosa MF-IS2 TaxID=1400762 RepID=A0A9P6C7B4_9AGAR|nr:proteasome maturation factor UMP1 [Macrolepiota fuliginosa MF-IS2]
MEPSLRLVPKGTEKIATISDTANSLGLHDTLTYGPRNLAAEVKSTGGIKDRLENWEETQDMTKLTALRNIYGMHAPMRLLMERKIVNSLPTFPGMSKSNLHLDILMGRDELIEPADIFLGMETSPPTDPRREMEKAYRI